VSTADAAADAPDPGRYVVLGAAGTDPASPLAACLSARSRTATATWTDAAPDPDGVRALILLGAGDDPEATAALIRALSQRHTPVLAGGHGAGVLAAALSGQHPPSEAGLGSLRRLRRTAEADEPTTSDLVDGSLWLVVDTPGVTPQGATILAVTDDDDAPAAFSPWPGCVAIGARLDLPASQLVAAVGDPGELAGREAFFDAWATALVGRWVDEVVGRTDAEAPWGRRGPPPVYDEDLFLGAKQQTGWSPPAGPG
jgi:hypothetical protein